MMTGESRVHEIDGLRGIAILAVVIYHWALLFLSPDFPEIGKADGLILLAYGVDLFFVISGFLIGTILLKIESPSGMGSFYIRRIVRIWPLYYLLLGIVYLSLPEKDLFTRAPFWSFPFFIFNFWESLGKGFHPMLVHLWSIAVEEQFYVLGPMLFVAFSRKQISLILRVCIFLSPLLRLILLYHTDVDVWRFTPTRIDGICIGLLLSLFLSSTANVSFVSRHLTFFKRLMFLLLTLLIPCQFLLPDELWTSFGHSLVVLTFGCVLMVVQVQCSLHQRVQFLNWTWLRYLGLRCYSIYLFHIFFSYIAFGINDNPYVGSVLEAILILFFAHFSWRYIETPLITFGRRFSYRKVNERNRAPA